MNKGFQKMFENISHCIMQTPSKTFHFEKMRTAKEHVDNYHIFNISGVWGRSFARSSNLGMSYLKQRFT